MTVGSTPRLALTTWSSDLDQVDRVEFSATISALDTQCVPDYYDLSANINNYAASAGSWFYAVDTQAHYVGTGASWQPILRRVDTTVTSGSLPAANAGNKAQWFWTSDTSYLYRSNGASMVVIETPASAPPSSPPPVGTIITMLPGASVNAASTTWLPCNGQGIAKASYPSLFNLIGYSYGGSGVTMDLPNLGGFQGFGRPSALSQAGSVTSTTLGFTGGLQTWTAPAAGVWGGSITVTVVGGGGGGTSGGTGSSVNFVYTGITPNQVLDIYVGGQGQTISGTFQGGYAYGYHLGGAPFALDGNELTYGQTGAYGTLGFGGGSSAVTFNSGALLCEAGAGGGQGWIYAESASTTTVTKSFTGGTQTFSVPACWGQQLTITAVGAGGGSGGTYGQAGFTGGAAASVTATVVANAGDTLTITVGGAGGTGSTGNTSGTAGGGAAGYNGGGQGGNVGEGNQNGIGSGGGGGGGATFVVDSTTSTTLVVAAGGGGGGWGGEYGVGGEGVGGAGGAPNGATGGTTIDIPTGGPTYYAYGGAGATDSGSGAGGGYTGGGANGNNGSGATGGAGAYAGGDGNFEPGGGGGGGGYFGGGGGGVVDAGGGVGSAGGGGGSSYVVGSGTGVSYSTSSPATNGTVTITYTADVGPTYNQVVLGGNAGQTGSAGAGQTFGSAYSNGGGGGSGSGGAGGTWQSVQPGATSGQAPNGSQGGAPTSINGGQGYPYAGGGGGGAGYAGGGAGAYSVYLIQGQWNTNEWSGGGGGSSYVASGSGSGVSNVGYANQGSPVNGSVTISYTVVGSTLPVSKFLAYIRVL